MPAVVTATVSSQACPRYDLGHFPSLSLSFSLVFARLLRHLWTHGLLSGPAQVLLNCLRMYSTEGDNNVLYLQTARFLMSSWRSASTGDVDALAGGVRYYAELAANDGAAIESQKCTATTIEELCNTELQLVRFEL